MRRSTQSLLSGIQSALVLGLACLLGCRSPSALPASQRTPHTPTAQADDAADAPNAPAVAESPRGGLTEYSDPANGVAFRYPSAWRPWHTGSTMYAPGLTETAAGAATITQVFDPQSTQLAKTNLVGLSFAYAVQKTSGSKACTDLMVQASIGGKEAPPETINGTSFERAEGSDGTTCHHMQRRVDSATRNGTCYLFERDLETICPGVRGPGDPVALSTDQQRALSSELDRVMASVTLRQTNP